MALPSSGAISLSAIASEFGDSTPNSINEFYRGGSLVPTLSTNNSVPTSGIFRSMIFMVHLINCGRQTLQWALEHRAFWNVDNSQSFTALLMTVLLILVQVLELLGQPVTALLIFIVGQL